MFRFAAQANDSGKITFSVRQTYSDGTVVDWNGRRELGHAQLRRSRPSRRSAAVGTSTIAIVALVLGDAALVVAVIALVGGKGKRALA